MSESAKSLVRLLRCEMTAVNQQFTHILSLRARGDHETAARIARVDNVEFVNVLRIADHLIGTGVVPELDCDLYVTGCSRTSMLRAEQAMEGRMAAAIAAVACEEPVYDQLVAPALSPRADYAKWLSRELENAGPDRDEGRRFGAEVFDLVAYLTAQMEQALIHAFLHRQAGDSRAADAAWATSGAAMMQLTRIARRLAREGSTPYPGSSQALRIARAPDQAPDLERELAAQTAVAAEQAAADSGHPDLAALCRDIAESARRLSDWTGEGPHPAHRTNPPGFHSFEKTCARYFAGERSAASPLIGPRRQSGSAGL